jgi:SAM-dependent methyltransferase
MTASVTLTNQWNDLQLRSIDPYAHAKYDILMDHLGPVRGLTVLVVGSGSGEFAAFLARAGAQVTALDIDAPTVELTLQTARRLEVPVEGIVSTLENFQTSRRFDVVAATDVVEHIEDDRSAVQKLKNLCKAGGRLVITVPALPVLFGYHDEALGHYRRYTPKTLRAVIPSDWSIQMLRYYGFFLIPVAGLISRILRRPYPVASVNQFKERSKILGFMIQAFFRWERHVSPPLGTSLLLIARYP